MAFSGSSTSSPRRREKTIPGAASAIASSGKPSAMPAAIAARALSRLWASTKGKLNACSPAGVRTTASVSPASARTQVASTSPPGPKRSSVRRTVEVRLERPGVGGHDGSAAGSQPVDDLGLRRGDRLDGAEQLDVDRARRW